MSSIEEKKKPPKKKTTMSLLTSPQTMMGKEIFNKISKDPMNLILAMAGKDHQNSNFSNENMRGANYDGYDLRGSNFNEADLTNASFMNCDLNGCSFEGAIMNGIILDNSRMNNCNYIYNYKCNYSVHSQLPSRPISVPHSSHHPI